MSTAPEGNLFHRTVWLLAVLTTGMVVELHFYLLFHAGGLWRDEVQVVNLAGSGSLIEMARDSFPVLMPLLVWGWSALGLGQSDWGLRLLGLLIGLGLPAALWLAAWTARRGPPLLSLVLLALNTTVVFYGDSLRAYGLGSGLIVLTAGIAWAFLNRPTWSRAGLLAASAILSVQALYQNAVLFAAICFGAWMVCWQRRNSSAALKILVAAVAAASSLLPYWQHIAVIPAQAASLRMGFMPAVVFGHLKTVLTFPLPQYIFVWELLVLVVIGLGVASARCSRVSEAVLSPTNPAAGDLPLFAAATLLAAVAGFIGFLWYAAMPTQSWYFLPLAALVAVCFEFGAPGLLFSRYLRAVSLGFLAATALLAVLFAQRDLDRQYTDIDRLARRLAVEASPQDLIVVTPWFCGITFERYFKGATPWQTLPPLADHSRHRYDLVQEKMKAPHALQPIFDKIAATLQAGHHVWVVGDMDVPAAGMQPPADLPPPPLEHYGWSDLPYSATWAAQTAVYLANDSVQFARVDHEPDSGGGSQEAMHLFEASGWRVSTPTNSPSGH
jgi:hypothetical protein